MSKSQQQRIMDPDWRLAGHCLMRPGGWGDGGLTAELIPGGFKLFDRTGRLVAVTAPSGAELCKIVGSPPRLLMDQRD